eukprot:PRCOL_00005964-RA
MGASASALPPALAEAAAEAAEAAGGERELMDALLRVASSAGAGGGGGEAGKVAGGGDGAPPPAALKRPLAAMIAASAPPRAFATLRTLASNAGRFAEDPKYRQVSSAPEKRLALEVLAFDGGRQALEALGWREEGGASFVLPPGVEMPAGALLALQRAEAEAEALAAAQSGDGVPDVAADDAAHVQGGGGDAPASATAEDPGRNESPSLDGQRDKQCERTEADAPGAECAEDGSAHEAARDGGLHAAGEVADLDDGMVWYDVLVRTSEVRGAGSDASFDFALLGEDGETERLYPAFEAGAFDSGAQTEFSFRAAPVGELLAVVVGNDAAGLSPAWLGDSIIVRARPSLDAVDEVLSEFDVDTWLAPEPGGRRAQRTFHKRGTALAAAAAAQAPSAEYRVTVWTTDVRGAGTTAGVSITLNGSKAEEGPLPLESGPDDFARGSACMFVLRARDVGELERIIIAHDDSGYAPAWHLDQVEKPRHRYRLIVRTSTAAGAGTSANVSATLYGSDGDTGAQPLESAIGPRAFALGATSAFTFDAATVGQIQMLRMSHDSAGDSPGWKLEDVEVSDLTSGDVCSFYCGRWLDKDREDSATSRLLTCDVARWADAGTGGGAAGAQQDWEPPIVAETKTAIRTARTAIKSEEERVVALMEQHRDWMQQEAQLVAEQQKLMQREAEAALQATVQHGQLSLTGAAPPLAPAPVVPGLTVPMGRAHVLLGVEYVVTVVTADKRHAGTTANPSLTIVGPGGTTEAMPLRTKPEQFTRDRTDVVTVMGADVGKAVYSVVLAHDQSGQSPGWFVEKLTVARREPEASDGASGQEQPATVIAEFSIDDWLDGARKTGSHERTLVVEDAASAVPATRKGKGPAEEQDVKKAPAAVDMKGESGKDVPPGCAEYRLSLKTGDVRAGGTTANVTAEIVSAEGATTGVLKLVRKGPAFERDGLDTFVLIAPEVGPSVTELRLSQDGSGTAPGWRVESADVLQFMPHRGLKVETSFQAGVWLDSKRGDGRTSRALPSQRSDVVTGDAEAAAFASSEIAARASAGVIAARTATVSPVLQHAPSMAPLGAPMLQQQAPGMPSSEPRYVITIVTSDVRQAGTTANVSVTLQGTQGTTRAFKFPKTVGAFGRHDTDELTAEGSDVGQITGVLLAHDGAGTSSRWHVATVDVKKIDQASGRVLGTASFVHNGWIEGPSRNSPGQAQLGMAPMPSMAPSAPPMAPLMAAQPLLASSAAPGPLQQTRQLPPMTFRAENVGQTF